MTKFFSHPVVVAVLTGIVAAVVNSLAVLHGVQIHIDYIRGELSRHEAAIVELQHQVRR